MWLTWEIDCIISKNLKFFNPPGIPLHRFIRQDGPLIILFQKSNPPNICNDTRIQIKNLRNNIIETIIFNDPAVQLEHILRIPLV